MCSERYPFVALTAEAKPAEADPRAQLHGVHQLAYSADPLPEGRMHGLQRRAGQRRNR
jgi:hypothetical protein